MTTGFDAKILEAEIIRALHTVYDPEIPIDIYELGLIYEVNVTPPGMVDIKMTLTTPNCPEAQSLPAMVEAAIRGVEQVVDVNIEIVWEPAWTKDNMTDEARLLLGIE